MMVFSDKVSPFASDIESQLSGPIEAERLRVCMVPFKDFKGNAHSDGKLVVLDVLADDVIQIFKTLYKKNFPIEIMQSMDTFQYSDSAAMAANNTSAFNPRYIEGTKTYSLHAYGAAIDLNPMQNPLVEGSDIQPAAGHDYRDRSVQRPGMVESVKVLFAQNGFTIWGGNWNDFQDYHHFQVPRDVVEKIVAVDYEAGCALFQQHKKMSKIHDA